MLAALLVLCPALAAGRHGLYLAINPLAYVEDGQVVKRRLEVNWHGEEALPGDRILLLTKENETAAEVTPSQIADGFFVFPGNLPSPTMEEMGFGPTCVFGLRAEWRDQAGALLAGACLQSQPAWMEEHSESLGRLPVGQLMLAGAHDAGAYRDYQGVGDDNWATSAVFAQEEDLLHQLLWGVRFLDIRAGFYPTTDERFWMVHGIIKTHPMMEGVEDVKEFLRNTREVVVWEINGFEQHWTAEAHEEFKALLVHEFGPWLVPPGPEGWEALLSSVWATPGLAAGQGRVIVTYNTGYTDPQLFFPEAAERWGNVDEPEDLRRFLEGAVAEAEGNPAAYRPWKPNCQMTPNQEDIIGGRWSGLRAMADAVNRNVTRWWREDWPDLPATFPISDFVRSTNMVQESIERNLRLAAGY